MRKKWKEKGRERKDHLENLMNIVLPGNPPQTLLFAWPAMDLCFSFYCGGKKAIRQMYAVISLMPLISYWVRVASSGQGLLPL